MSTIAENIVNIRAQMNEAAKKAGRDPSEILLCAATKMNDADRVKEAVAAGVDCCGENRVQEIQAKRPLGAYTGRPLHFIGHLQTNKVKYLVGVVDLIESVDRLELLECIEKQAEKTGVVVEFIEIVVILGIGLCQLLQVIHKSHCSVSSRIVIL